MYDAHGVSTRIFVNATCNHIMQSLAPGKQYQPVRCSEHVCEGMLMTADMVKVSGSTVGGLRVTAVNGVSRCAGHREP